MQASQLDTCVHASSMVAFISCQQGWPLHCVSKDGFYAYVVKNGADLQESHTEQVHAALQ